MSFPRPAEKPTGWWLPLMSAVLVALAWFCLWYLPWQATLQSFVWLRLGIGLALFIIPGACVYGFLLGRSAITFSHVTFGFVISHLLFALLGTLGRFTHLSFGTIKLLMALLGSILMILYLPSVIRNGIKTSTGPIKLRDLIPVLLLILVALAACLVVIQRVLTDDDLTYLAYVTNWQNSLHLDFNDIIFGEAGLVHPRFWLMSAPFAQALLADLSRVPGILLLNGYYEPFLVVLSVLCWYELARTLKFSPRAASASSMLQLAFLLMLSDYLHPGSSYFTQLSADKATAAFIVAPVFFQSLIRLLDQPTKHNGFLLLFTGLSLTLMHPVILAYSVFIGGALILFRWTRGVSLSKLVLPTGILIIILSPQIALRFMNVPSQADIPYAPADVLGQAGMENLIQRWGNTQFYGFNPDILDMNVPYAESIPIPAPIAGLGWLVLPVLSAAFAVTQARRNAASQFILACFLLCFLAFFPFTGWIIGYFLSAWMLERALWLFPFGLSAVHALSFIRDLIKARMPVKKTPVSNAQPPSYLSLLTIAFLTLGLFLLYMRENSLPDFDKFSAKSQRVLGLATAGQELDRQISTQAFVVGSQNLNDLIPGVSSKSKMITFRTSQPSNMPYFSDAQREERLSDMERLFSRALSPEDKMGLIEKYDIRFLLLQSFDLRLFNDLIDRYPGRVQATELGGVIIVQVVE